MSHLGRILIVDDEPKIRSFIGRALASAGYATDFSGNGADAVASALKTHYDLVILDRKSTRLNSSHYSRSRMPSSA